MVKISEYIGDLLLYTSFFISQQTIGQLIKQFNIDY